MGRTTGKLVCAFAVLALLLASRPAVGESRQIRARVQILSNSDFDAEHGVSSGKGTKEDPYVISGLELVALDIENTSKYVDIHSNTITGQLVLDWIGDRAKVHHNRIAQLHVNRNRPRTGGASSGVIVHNTIGNVSQLRHWDGLFAYNTVGSPDKTGVRGANFDGFNGARFDHNKIYGWVDARLHGHHHSSGYGQASHMHDGMPHGADHSQRYHEVSVTNNVISAKHSYGLAYLDTNHAANDRTAPSERDPALNEPHAHHTHVLFAGNKLYGGGILINVFNANDPHHIRTYMGMVEIEHNSVTLDKDDVLSGRGQLMGIEVVNARDLHLMIEGNRITGWRPSGPLAMLEQRDTNAGVYLHNIDKAHVWVVDNSVANRTYGVRAENFTVSVMWVVADLSTKNVKQPVHYDNVPRKPESA
jgi:hypothetical protein